MRILIAEDDRTSALMLGRTLEKWGFEVVIVHDGAAAWECIAGNAPPELAIVDWMMPEIDGIELCTRIRATPRETPVYVILLTARTSRQDLVAGLEAGADDYLTKPFDPDELRARIRVGQRTLGLMANIKRLTGLLPMCAYCKRIRSDDDYWLQLENYISQRTNAEITHGICPSCLENVLKELDRGLPPPPASA